MTYCCFSIDDDDVEYWRQVAEMLEPYGAKMTVFVTTSKIEPLEEAALFDLSYLGHEVAVHSWSHKPLATLKPSDWPHEVMDAADWIEKITGVPVTSHAMPYGNTSQEYRVWMRTSTNLLGARAVGHCIKPLGEIDPYDVPVMDRNRLKGNGSERDIRFNTNHRLSICKQYDAPFLFYSHNAENMTVEQVQWVVDELYKAGEKLITFSDFLRKIKI